MLRSATAASTCTMGNFGPGFDVLSLALDRPGDVVTVAAAARDEVRVTGSAEGVPARFEENCASVAAAHLRDALGLTEPLLVTVEKRVPRGSGLGSSASSSAAGALAMRALHPEAVVTNEMLLEAAAAGERVAAGDHRDDVAAALFGGLALVSPRPGPVLRLDPPRHLRLAVALPRLVLETRRMRAVLPKDVPRADVVHNLAMVARLVDAVHRGDVPAMGRAMDDRVAVPYRAPLVPRYAEAREAALAAGAYGHCLSGSGPAQFAVCDSDALAERALAAMLEVYRKADVAAEGFVAAAAPGRDVA